MKTIKLTVDEAICTGCGLCEERAPENMEVSPIHDVARVIKQPVGVSETEDCLEAAEYCPTGGLVATAREDEAENAA